MHVRGRDANWTSSFHTVLRVHRARHPCESPGHTLMGCCEDKRAPSARHLAQCLPTALSELEPTGPLASPWRSPRLRLHRGPMRCKSEDPGQSWLGTSGSCPATLTQCPHLCSGQPAPSRAVGGLHEHSTALRTARAVRMGEAQPIACVQHRGAPSAYPPHPRKLPAFHWGPLSCVQPGRRGEGRCARPRSAGSAQAPRRPPGPTRTGQQPRRRKHKEQTLRLLFACFNEKK